jgi:preprotein translocase subunit SecF
MFQIVKPDINIDFLGLRRPAFVLSAMIIAAGLVSLVAKGGPNYGIDFAGGLMLHVGVDESVAITEIREAAGTVDVEGISVQEFENEPGQYLLRVPTPDEEVGGGIAATIKGVLSETFGDRGFEERRTEIVGPQVGRELRRRGILSVLFATLAMGAYIAIRFELRFGIGAGLALLHDVLITIGALSLFNVEINLSALAAILTVIGYSVNDTVVVSDRIRENLRKDKNSDLAETINRSINETLSRTLLTTGTSLMVLFSLFFVGGGVIHGFALTLIVGLTAGTYSSIFIASPVVEMWTGRKGALTTGH